MTKNELSAQFAFPVGIKKGPVSKDWTFLYAFTRFDLTNRRGQENATSYLAAA